MCGLKQTVFYDAYRLHAVTPFVGVWIETLKELRAAMDEIVTPFVGVWIETRETL